MALERMISPMSLSPCGYAFLGGFAACRCTLSGALRGLSGPHRTIEEPGFVEMIEQPNPIFRVLRTLALTALVAVCGATVIRAQAPPAQPPPDPQKQQPKPPAESNPVPEDTNSVPVIPTGKAPAAPEANPSAAPMPPSGPDDPVRSPDDPVGNPDAEGASGFSSSSSGLDKFNPPPEADTRGRRRGKSQDEPQPHQE